MGLPALAAALALAGGAPALPQGPVSIEAGTVRCDGTFTRCRVEGGAVLRRGQVVLRAQQADLDQRTGEVTASGGVLLTDATRVVAADALRVVMGGALEAEGVTAVLKERPLDLGGAATLAEAHVLGANRLSLSARRIRGGTGPGARLEVEGARLTLCDCGPGVEPTWALRAKAADVVPGERAILTWPVLYLRPPFAARALPVLPLPWLYVPLGDRQTGLLFPELASTRATGFAFTQPLFVTLGEHADLTLSPGWAVGHRREEAADPLVSGPMARLEARWAPAADAEGRAELLWVHDTAGEPGGASGHRFGLELRHQQGSQRTLALGAELALDEDGVLHRDFTSGTDARAATYQRSSLLAGHLAGPVLVEAGSTYLQPLQPGGAAGPYGLAGVDVDLAHPLAWLSATAPATRAGPLLASGRAGVVRRAPVHGGAAVDGRPETTRLDGRLELELPLVLGPALALSPFVRGAAAAYSGDGGGQVAWGLAGARASSEVARRYGALRHTVGASAEWRLGSPAIGDAPAHLAFDAFDRVALTRDTPTLSAAPPGRFHQLRLAADTRLALAGATRARLTAGRDFDLEAGRAAELFGSGAVAMGPVRAELRGRFPSLGAWSELGARLELGAPRGHRLWADYRGLQGRGGGEQTAGLDVLFDPSPRAVGPATRVELGAQLALGPALVAYEAVMPGRDRIVSAKCGARRRLEAAELYEQVARLAWESPCRCFRAAVQVEVDACGDVSGLSGKLEIARR